MTRLCSRLFELTDPTKLHSYRTRERTVRMPDVGVVTTGAPSDTTARLHNAHFTVHTAMLTYICTQMFASEHIQWHWQAAKLDQVSVMEGSSALARLSSRVSPAVNKSADSRTCSAASQFGEANKGVVL